MYLFNVYFYVSQILGCLEKNLCLTEFHRQKPTVDYASFLQRGTLTGTSRNKPRGCPTIIEFKMTRFNRI